jgi:twitching motility two-component system response regulator PilH
MAKILIVDDSPTEIHLLKSLLERHSYQVIEATSGDQGVELANTQRPDLVLMDIVMPGLNGFQATRQISRNARTAHIPVVIVTSKNQETDRVWGERQGARGYLVKPIQESALLGAIEELLAEPATSGT